MHRNVARAYDYLKREHDRIRAAHVKILAQKDRHLERLLFRADLDSSRYFDESDTPRKCLSASIVDAIFPWLSN